MEWLSKFFNGTHLQLPEGVLKEMAAAGLKEYTVQYLMSKFTHRLELANYLATVLRVTQIEREAIAEVMLRRREDPVEGLKIEELD